MRFTKAIAIARVCKALALAATLSMSAEDIYVSQTGAGTHSGVDAANAQTRAWLITNDSGTWGPGPGKISAGDTVHLVGSTWTDDWAVFGDGTAGNVITMRFETDFSLVAKAPGYMPSRSYIVVDLNGHYLEATDNGTLLGHQLALNGIEASGCNNVEFKSGAIRGMFVHVAGNDGPNTLGAVGGIYMNGMGANVKIHDITFSDIPFCIVAISGTNNTTGFEVYSNSFSAYDHGVVSMQGMGAAGNPALIHDNHFGATANWDSPSDLYHHDGIHIFFGTGPKCLYDCYNNLFDGDWGLNNTAHIYNEGDVFFVDPHPMPNCRFWNNVHVVASGKKLSNGFINTRDTGFQMLNNTFIGGGITATNSNGVGLCFNTRFENNVITGVTSYFYTPANVGSYTGIADYNIYAGRAAGGNAMFIENGIDYTTFAAWQAVAGEAHSSQISSALLNTNGTAQAGSAVIDTGIDLTSLGIFTTDKTGLARGSTWDIGAFEFVPTAGITYARPSKWRRR